MPPTRLAAAPASPQDAFAPTPTGHAAPTLVGGGHVPVLDAVRGLAILVVLVHNASYVPHGPEDTLALKLWGTVGGAGWAGVQLFFVLSGLLITGILLDSRGRAGWLRTFYTRRVLRIFPLYYAALLAYWVVVPRLLGVPRLAEAAAARPWHYWLYVSNWPIYPAGDPTSLTHFWSLAVEEQFYVVWPLAVLALSRRGLGALCAGLCAAAVAFRFGLHTAALPTGWADAIGYSWTIARMDALAFGALAALGLRAGLARATLARHGRRIAAAAGLAIVLLVLVRHGFHKTGLAVQVAGQTLVAVAAAGLLVALVTTEAWPVTRLLDRAWLRWLGRYSYGIYVVHVPLHRVGLHLAGNRLAQGDSTTRLLLSLAYVAVVLAASCLAALVTWHLIEAPFLRLKGRFVVAGARG